MARDKDRDRHNAETGGGEFDDQDAYERALRRESEDLPGDTEEDRNLSGGSTYETLFDEEENEDAANPDEEDGGRKSDR
jgi:hypothetical protein